MLEILTQSIVYKVYFSFVSIKMKTKRIFLTQNKLRNKE